MAAARGRLRDAGLSAREAELSARVLAQHVLGWSTERFLTDAVQPEPDAFSSPYDAAIGRRVAREPVAYIVGRREFWGLPFDVTPDVLIPRHETELIVEAALELHPAVDAPLRIADICTGSGCVAVAIASERPHASMIATDISHAALVVAKRNADRNGVGQRVHFATADLLDGIGGVFDLLVANPPYVRSGDRNGLQPEVREEPEVALYGGSEGLDAIARLVDQAPARLRPGAHLVFEFGLGQDLEIEQFLEDSDALTLVDLRRDLQGIARTAVARRR